MSAFICSDLHFSVIAAVIADNKQDVQPLADMLKAINIDSVNHRYNEKTRKTKAKLPKHSAVYSSADIYNLVRCWDYQSCEGDSLSYRMMSTWLMSQCKALNITEGDSKVWSI